MKITDQRTKPFGVKEAVEYLREKARGLSGLSLFDRAADEIERRAAGAGKGAEEREIKPGEWFLDGFGTLRLCFDDGQDGRNSVTTDGKRHNRPEQWCGIPVQVEILITDHEA